MHIFSNLGQYGSKVALICDDHKTITYGELTSIASKISNVITERCLIFVLGNNSRECIAGYLGIFDAYAVPALVDKNIDYDFLTSLINKFYPKYIYTPISRTDITNQYPTICMGHEYTLLSCNQYKSYDINEDLAQLIPTSGSTGSPKFVRQSYKNITSNIDSIVEYLAVDMHDRAITTMPMSYSYGLSIINTHLRQGASLILNNYSIVEDNFWSLMRSYYPTTFGGVPYFYKMLDRFKLNGLGVSSLRYLTHAGGQLNLELTRSLIRLCENDNIAFYSMYGQAEACPRMSYLPWNNASSKLGSIGSPIPGGKFWLEDQAGAIITTDNVVGQIVYQGSNVCLGYAECYSDLEKADENNGILYTGDTGYFDTDGFYFITGRTNRFLKVYGNRVNLDEVENLLKEAGYDVACSGSDDNIKIFVESGNDTKHIVDFISTKTRLNRTGFSTHVVDFIPRTNSGKIIYTDLV